MKVIFIILSILGAAFIEWLLNLSVGGVVLPLTVTTVFLWFWRLPLGYRFILGTSVGFILDSFRFLPFGTYLLAFGVLAVLVSMLQISFSNSKSAFTQGISLAVALTAFFFLAIWGSTMLGKINSEPVQWTGALWNLVMGATFWTSVLSVFWFTAVRLSTRT